jgi:nitroreductase
METLKALETRRSIREFTPQPISEDDIKKVINAARLAPSANNIQPWEFIIVTSKETRQRIAAITDYGKFIADAPVCIACFCKETKYYLEDGSAATENILIAAWALGIGSCWVAGDKKRYASQIGELLGVPPRFKLVSLIALGYPARKVSERRLGKRNLEEVLHWEKF